VRTVPEPDDRKGCPALDAAAERNVRALPSSSPPVGFDRVPPHNLDAEVSVLGSMLLSKNAIAEVTEVVGAEDFYRGAHRTMFEAIRDLYDRGEPVDAVTLADELAKRGALEDVGGPTAIADILAKVPTSANALHYARIVGEQAIRRRLIETGTQITRLGYDATEDVDIIVDEAEQRVYNVAQLGRVSEFTPMKQLITEGFAIIERLHESNSAITGLATGFSDFDELTSGLQPANLVILAARPAMGKCLPGATLVLDPATGARRRLDELVAAGRRGEPVRVATLGEDLRLRPADVAEVHDNGVQRVLRVRTRTGREIVATANHPLLTPAGWVALEDLGRGARIAVPAALPYFGARVLDDGDVRALVTGLTGGTPAARALPEAVFELDRRRRCGSTRPRARSRSPRRARSRTRSSSTRRTRSPTARPRPGRPAADPRARRCRRHGGCGDGLRGPPRGRRPVGRGRRRRGGRGGPRLRPRPFVTNIAVNVAVEQRKPAVLFSLEMSKMELVQRVLAAEARVDSDRLRTGRLQESDWPKLSQAMGRLAEAPLFIDDTPGINMMEIRSKSRRLKQKHGLDLIIVDYLQLMQSHRRRRTASRRSPSSAGA
jgi:replicative DNA helicase